MRKDSFSTLISVLHYRSLYSPDKVAYTFLKDGKTEVDSLTYRDIDRRARAVAAQLQLLGLKAGDRALLLYPPCLEFIVAFFGCLYAGIIAVPVYPPEQNRSMSRLEAIVADAEASIALTNNNTLLSLEERIIKNPCLVKLQWLATDNVEPDMESAFIEQNLSGDTLAFFQYTSGSTGLPKGVMVSHKNLLDNSTDLDLGWKHTTESIMVSWLPFFHDMGLIYGVIQPLYKGFSCYLMSPMSFLRRPIRWLEAISNFKASHSAAPNFAYELCLRKITPEQRSTLDLSSWRMALNGAEPVRPKILQQFYETFKPCGFELTAFCPGYGLAEATLKVTAVRRDAPLTFSKLQADTLLQNRVLEVNSSIQKAQVLVGCGFSEIDTNIVIVHPESLTKCASDEVGEIWVSGSTVAQGYWRKPQETQQTFHAYLADTNEGPFLRTGDLGFLKNGELFVTGRLKDVIIIWGRNHFPQDIELTVEQSHIALRTGCGAAFGLEIEGEERLVIVQEVERSYLQTLNTEEVIGNIRQAVMAQHNLPIYSVILAKPGNVPKTSSGKIQRRECRNKFINGSLQVVNQVDESLKLQKALVT